MQGPQISSVNLSNTSSVLPYRDPSSIVVTKNMIALALGITINYINGTLIHTFRKHQIFHVNPRYILFIHLVLNDMIQLNTALSLFVLSYIFYKINVSFCCLIITLVVFTTLNTPLNLAAMAVECYIAICLPLRHNELCSVRRAYIVIGWIWAFSSISILPDVFIIVATEPFHFIHSRIFCERDNLFHHPVSLKKRDVSYIIYLMCVWLTLLYTYIKIFLVAKSAKSGDGDAKKARNTILLHGFQLLLSMLTYVAHELIKALVFFFPSHQVHVVFTSYIIIQILPRIVSPLVYGLRDRAFRKCLGKYLLCVPCEHRGSRL